MDDDKFSLDNFKRWIRNDKGMAPKMNRRTETLEGVEVESKISAKRLAGVIEVEDGAVEEVAVDFQENGGRIASVDGKRFLIECEAGSFFVARHYVTRR